MNSAIKAIIDSMDAWDVDHATPESVCDTAWGNDENLPDVSDEHVEYAATLLIARRAQLDLDAAEESYVNQLAQDYYHG